MVTIDKEWFEHCVQVHDWDGEYLFLGCHALPQCRQYYFLPCNVLPQKKSKKMRVKIFGRRFYYDAPVERIAYVEPHKVKSVSERLV